MTTPRLLLHGLYWCRTADDPGWYPARVGGEANQSIWFLQQGGIRSLDEYKNAEFVRIEHPPNDPTRKETCTLCGGAMFHNKCMYLE